jgi:alkanesulfonate monooxygenase SsuD/methylene tetrahydromethanopterin reductase-like flavin-dependent oxidoreductase (luciferase family)
VGGSTGGSRRDGRGHSSEIEFYTSVLKLGSRNPVLLAGQVGSVAALTGGRFGLGLGVGWSPEEFE